VYDKLGMVKERDLDINRLLELKEMGEWGKYE